VYLDNIHEIYNIQGINMKNWINFQNLEPHVLQGYPKKVDLGISYGKKNQPHNLRSCNSQNLEPHVLQVNPKKVDLAISYK